MSLKIFLTSPMAIESGDIVVDSAAIGSPQVRLALAFLVTKRRRAVPRAELADVLWPQSLPGSWEGALRGVVSRVRGALGAAGLSPADVVTSAFGCYQLHLPPDTVVDVEAAAAAMAAAEDALSDGDPEEACQHAVVARRLAARPFLPEEGGDWVDQQRVELRNLLLRALDAVGDAHLGRGRPELAVEAAEAAVAAEPFREAAYRRLMTAHVAAGSRGEALRAYERCRRALALPEPACPAGRCSSRTAPATSGLRRRWSAVRRRSEPAFWWVVPARSPLCTTETAASSTARGRWYSASPPPRCSLGK